MRVTRHITAVLAATLAISSLVACSSSKTNNGTAATVDVLNVGMPNGPQTENHNPFLGSSAGASLGYRYMIFEPLVMLNQVRPADPGVPWLATKWTWSDNYSTLDLTIRDGVTWSGLR